VRRKKTKKFKFCVQFGFRVITRLHCCDRGSDDTEKLDKDDISVSVSVVIDPRDDTDSIESFGMKQKLKSLNR
jgi:hypothetical protein